MWKTKEGKFMLLSEMTEKHLENSIAYCNRRGDGESLEALHRERKRRDEEKLQNELNQFLEENDTCQFCGSSLKPKAFEFESDREESIGMGWYYTEYRLTCKCGAMGPVIKTTGFKPN